MIRESGMRPSSSIKGRPRWSRKGVNLVDLCDIGNELTRGRFLPLMSHEVLFSKPGETQKKLLGRVHQRFETSLDKGLPPIISLRRYVRRGENGKPPEWIMLDAHFVTITSVPRKLETRRHIVSHQLHRSLGRQNLPGDDHRFPPAACSPTEAADSPCLEAVFPEAAVGKKLLRPGESSTLTVVAVLGRW